MIPASVKHADLMTALEPVMTLLGTSVREVAATPPFMLTIHGPTNGPHDHLGLIEFTVAKTDATDQLAADAHAVLTTIGDVAEFSERAYKITVEVI